MGRYPDPILRRRAQPVTSFGPQLTLLADALWATARAEGAVGLAASQAGVDARVIVLDPAVVGWEAENVMVNPRITSRTDEDEMAWWRERCLVLPDDVLVTLMRDSGVTVAAQDLSGRAFSQQLSGEAARAMQHELDHLDGILILDHATDPEDLMSKVFPQLAQMEAAEHEQRQALAFARVVEE